MESQGIHTVMQLNKDIEQCPSILPVLCKIQNRQHIQVNQEETEEKIRAFIQSALYSCLKTVLQNNPENE